MYTSLIDFNIIRRLIGNMGLLNIGSLGFGLLAWGLPLFNLINPKTKASEFYWDSIWSLSSCGIALCFQIIYTNYIVTIEDWIALMDTAQTVAVASATLLIMTILLNFTALIILKKRQVE